MAQNQDNSNVWKSDGTFPDEEWNFTLIPKVGSQPNRSEPYKTSLLHSIWREFLFYELCRELPADTDNETTSALIEVTHGEFPRPFLLLTVKTQKALIQYFQDPDSPFQILARQLQELEMPFSTRPHFNDSYQSSLEDSAWAAAIEMSEKHPGTKPEDFSPLTNPGEIAFNQKANEIITTLDPKKGALKNDDIFDHSKYTLQCVIDLNYEDSVLIERFKAILAFIRKTYDSTESRIGKSPDSTDYLQRIAALRLKRTYGAYSQVEAEMQSRGITEIPKLASGWNKSISKGKVLIHSFKSALSTPLSQVRMLNNLEAISELKKVFVTNQKPTP